MGCKHSKNVLASVVNRLDDDTTELNVCGDKRTCKRIANPTDEQVEELMERYVNALQSLFEQYKIEAGYPNDMLHII